MIKAKKGFLLRRLGKQYMIVAIGKASEEFNGMIKTNETGAFYWNELKNGISEDELIKKMLEKFEGLDEDTARHDLREFLKGISIALEENE